MTTYEDIFTLPDMCYEISKYLSYIELLQFSIYFPQLKIKPPSFKNIIKRKLNNLNVNPNEFLNRLIDTKSVISGSFVLQCLLSNAFNIVHWDNSDIDVYCPYYAGNCTHCDNRHLHRNTSEFSIYLCEKSTWKDCDIYPLLDISSSRKWNLGNTVINDISLTENTNINKFINDTFDYDFCKVVFDGVKLHLYKLDSLIKKQTIYEGDSIPKEYYYDYGNVWFFPFFKGHLINSAILKTLSERLIKYTNRGFNIKVNPNLLNHIKLDIISYTKQYTNRHPTQDIINKLNNILIYFDNNKHLLL